MDKVVLDAVVKSISKEEIEKHLPEIRRKIGLEISSYFKSKKWNKFAKELVKESIRLEFDEGNKCIEDIIGQRNYDKLLQGAIRKILR